MAHFSMTIIVQGINAIYMASLTHAVLLSVQILSVLKGKVASSLALIPSGKFNYSLPKEFKLLGLPHPSPPRSTPPYFTLQNSLCPLRFHQFLPASNQGASITT